MIIILDTAWEDVEQSGQESNLGHTIYNESIRILLFTPLSSKTLNFFWTVRATELCFASRESYIQKIYTSFEYKACDTSAVS